MSLNEKFGRGFSGLGKVSIRQVPDRSMLQKLSSDLSIAAPGTECEITWQSGLNTFVLALKFSRETARANWKLYLGKGAQPRLIWEYDTNEIAIVHQLLLAEIQKQAKSSQSMNAISEVRGTTAPPEERRAANIDKNLSGKLRQLFVSTQQDIIDNKNIALPVVSSSKSGKSATEYVDLTPGKELLQNLFVNQLGIFSTATFLFLLEREYEEAVANKSPITLVLFKPDVISTTDTIDSVPVPLHSTVIQVTAKTLQHTQRKTDILAQMTENKFAVLLTDTNAAGGRVFVSRVQKALQKVSSASAGEILPKFIFGMATLSDRCKTLPDLLYFADKSLTKARQTKKDLASDQDIPNPTPEEQQKYLNRSVDLKPTRQLVGQLISAGIFTYPAFLGFLEHEFYRNARKKRDLLVLLFKVRVRSEKFDEATHLLPDQAFYEVIRRVGSVLTKRDVFAHYSHGNFVVMRSNASVTEMRSLSKRVMQSVTANQWLTPECSVESLRIRVQICTVRVHETSSTLFGFVPIE